MAVNDDSVKIVPPVDVAADAGGGSGPINPAALTPAQAAKVLSAVGNGPVTEEMIRRHIAAGAPTTADGRINLVHYAAWLSKDLLDNHGD
jgi:hypothetical protein